jgi:ABC-type multidrug transport system fused ATPase/permease subunit
MLFLTEPSVADTEMSEDLVDVPGKIVFDNVRFGYDYNYEKEHCEEEHMIFKGMSFFAEPGESIAFVGESGSGKSTILNMLLRFYDVKGGSITLDGSKLALHHTRQPSRDFCGSDSGSRTFECVDLRKRPLRSPRSYGYGN